MAKLQYWNSVLQPIFNKVEMTIKSARTSAQLTASQRYAELFLKMVKDGPDIGYLPASVNRGVLYFYYNSKINGGIYKDTVTLTIQHFAHSPFTFYQSI